MHRLASVRRQVNIQNAHIGILEQQCVIVGSGQKRIRATRNYHRLRARKAAARVFELHSDGVKNRITNVLDGMERFCVVEMGDDGFEGF